MTLGATFEEGAVALTGGGTGALLTGFAGGCGLLTGFDISGGFATVCLAAALFGEADALSRPFAAFGGGAGLRLFTLLAEAAACTRAGLRAGLVVAFLAPLFFKVAFCAMSFSLYHWLHYCNLTAILCSAFSRRAQTRPPTPSPPPSSCLSRPSPPLTDCSAMVWLPKAALASTFSSTSSFIQRRCEIRCDLVFEICSRLYHHTYPNTNFTDFEAGGRAFFSPDLMKGLSRASK
jgi:hypothetical protein